MKIGMSLLLVMASTLSFAQQGGIGALKIEPASARAGQEVKITVSADGEAPSYCGMVVHFGDGSESRNFKIDGNEAKFPVSFSRTFAKPGTFTVKAEGMKVTTHFPCMGKATASVVVEAAAEAAKPACPQGYKMIGKAGKAGDFSCKGAKGAAAPAKTMACADGLEYFANDKTAQLGCRKPKPSKK